MAGQIIKRGDGRWLVRIPLGRDTKGKRLYHNKTIRGLKRDAEAYRTLKLRELHTGAFMETSRQGIAEYLEEWLERVAATRVRLRTHRDYASLLRTHVIPTLGARRLDQLGPNELQGLFAGMTARGLSPRTVRYTHAVLSTALENAVRWRQIPHNPAKLVTLPRSERREVKALGHEQAGAFLDAARGTKYEALWILLLSTGMRPGEALALRWSDVSGDRIQIQRSLSWVSAKEWKFLEPKTDRARRVISLPPSTSVMLRSHRVRQHQQRLAAGPAWEDHDLVFCTGTGSPLEWRLVSRRHFKPLAQSVGLNELRPYDLRHSCATLLLSSGENIKVVSERLGHASATMTLDTYVHVLPDMQRQAADRMEQMLFSNRAATLTETA